ncbi:LamG-like jellyroll fold domain-containing protein [Acinetobacter sp. BSP-153]|uniref:LamG-like jellyroll fold domain-containing protein n=1 Tax=Acinetobacter sp. BSP-153 TaxID=3344663 RepID=UPI00376F6DEB
MTNRLELNWKLDGFVDEQRYYCSETPIDLLNLPPPKAILASDVRAYVDTDIDEKRYHLLLSSVKNSVEKFGEQVSVWASNKDEFYQQVELLLLANATSYPSTNIVDRSKYARAITRSGVSITNSLVTIDGGAFDYTTTSVVRYLQASVPALNTNDFTIEQFLKVNVNQGTYHRVFLFDTQESVSNGALQLQLASDGTTKLYINDGSIRQVGTSLNPTGNSLRHHCLMRKDGIFYYFLDGVLQSSYDQYKSYVINKTNFRLGGYSTHTIGYSSSLRITRAVRYNISGFTPPGEMFKTS